jgi:hypothetical protein
LGVRSDGLEAVQTSDYPVEALTSDLVSLERAVDISCEGYVCFEVWVGFWFPFLPSLYVPEDDVAIRFSAGMGFITFATALLRTGVLLVHERN